MTRRTDWNGIESAPLWIVMFLGAYLIVQLLVLHAWNAAGQVFSFQGTSGSASSLPVAAMAGVGLWLCLVVLRSFPPGAPLRSAWMLMTLAAAAAAGSGVLMQLLGTDWPLNPLAWTGHATPGLMERMQRFALIAGGPCRLALLAAAMLGVLRILRKFGFWVRPCAADRAVFGIFCLFTLCRFCLAGAASLAGSRIGFEEWVSLARLPILCVLFLEAMLLRQAVGRMGNGPIARGWLALVWGILLTGAGEAALWVIPQYPRSLPMAAFAALIQLPMAAAFALVPACQIAAQRQAIKPAGSRPEDLATGVPALAR